MASVHVAGLLRTGSRTSVIIRTCLALSDVLTLLASNTICLCFSSVVTFSNEFLTLHSFDFQPVPISTRWNYCTGHFTEAAALLQGYRCLSHVSCESTSDVIFGPQFRYLWMCVDRTHDVHLSNTNGGGATLYKTRFPRRTIGICWLPIAPPKKSFSSSHFFQVQVLSAMHH